MPLTNYGEVLSHAAAVAANGVTADGILVDCAALEVERGSFEVKCDQPWELYIKHATGKVDGSGVLNEFGVGQIIGSGGATGGNYQNTSGLLTAGIGFKVYIKNVGAAATAQTISVKCQVGD